MNEEAQTKNTQMIVEGLDVADLFRQIESSAVRDGIRTLVRRIVESQAKPQGRTARDGVSTT